MSKTKIQDKTYIGELPQKKNYIEIDGKSYVVGEKLLLVDEYGYSEVNWPNIYYDAVIYNVNDTIGEYLSGSYDRLDTFILQIDNYSGDGTTSDYDWSGDYNGRVFIQSRGDTEFDIPTTDSGWTETTGTPSSIHYMRFGLWYSSGLNMTLAYKDGFSSYRNAYTDNLKLYIVVTQELVDLYWENIETNSVLPTQDVYVKDNSLEGWTINWDPYYDKNVENGVILKIESEFSESSNGDDLDLSNINGKVQLNFIEIRKNIWECIVKKWDYVYPNYPYNITPDLVITEEEFNTIANAIRLDTLGKLLHINDTYTGEYGIMNFLNISGIEIEEGGTGKYRTASLLQTQYGDWLTKNENNIIRIVQVNNLEGKLSPIVCITYEAKIKTERTLEDETTNPDEGGE